MDVSDRRRIVILGKTESGKSSLANTIFGEKLFKVNHSFNSETTECQAKTKSVNGRRVTLIDTPGFFDTHKSEEELKPEIVRCITECAPGPHAFLIVLKVDRFTEQEQAVINKIRQYFSDEIFKYATVLFTHGDQLPEGMKIEEFFRDNKNLSDLVKKCGGRCHVIDNRYWNGKPKDEYRSNQFQVEELLNTIDKITEANNGSYYTNEMLQAAEAKSGIFKNILIQVAGIAKGALFGAFFGVALSGLAVSSMSFSTLTLAFALVGAVMTGITKYVKAEGAETPQEAANGAAEAVKNEAQSDEAN